MRNARIEECTVGVGRVMPEVSERDIPQVIPATVLNDDRSIRCGEKMGRGHRTSSIRRSDAVVDAAAKPNRLRWCTDGGICSHGLGTYARFQAESAHRSERITLPVFLIAADRLPLEAPQLMQSEMRRLDSLAR